MAVGTLEAGRGQPVTVIAPGGTFPAEQVQHHGDDLRGTRICFDWQASGWFEQVAGLRREADRDAGEVLAVSRAHSASRAIGLSRGARAVIGALADAPDLFERVVLVLPPGGHAAGKYASWLRELATTDGPMVTATFLVIAHRGDPGHPVRVAEAWAKLLAGRLEVLPSRELSSRPERIRELAAEFLNDGGR